ncbi:MAG: DUF1150 family protein [Thalassovita sp.]
MDAKYDFHAGEGAERLVYVRSIKVSELPQDLRDKAEGHETLYAVCNPDGKQLALVEDRETAFFLAREHDYAPVTVH